MKVAIIARRAQTKASIERTQIMMSVEADVFIKTHIFERWPRFKPTNIARSDWRRLLLKVDTETAVEAIIRAKETSKTITYPVLAEFRQKLCEVIKEKEAEKRKHTTFTPFGGYTPCWALHRDTGKHHAAMVLSTSSEGALTGMAMYLKKWGQEPTDYVIYVGEENEEAFFKARYALACRLNPKIAENVAKMQEKTPQELYDEIPF